MNRFRFAVVLLVLIMCGCLGKPKPQLIQFSGIAMTVPYHIQIGTVLSPYTQDQVTRIIHLTFDEVHAIYDQWNPLSEISALNRLKDGERAHPSSQLYQLLKLADQIVSLSEGRYDPTVEPLRQLWLHHLQTGKEPSLEEIAALKSRIGWEKVHLDQGWFWKDHDALQLNLDSLSKGCCVDLLVDRLGAAGFPNVLVEWGGELRAAGQHPEGRPWKVFIRKPQSEDPKEAIAQINLEDAALATSGDYLQNWTLSGITYFHILDARHYRPLTRHSHSVSSATVLAPSCAVADALATSAICFDSLNAAQVWAKTIEIDYGYKFWLQGNN